MNADGVPKEMMRVDDVLVRIANISLIEEKVHVAFSCYWHLNMTLNSKETYEQAQYKHDCAVFFIAYIASVVES